MKNITLEMVDKFIEETGFDYDEARAYLLAADGDLELAIEAALAKDGAYSRSSLDSFVEQVKELVKKGNLIRLVIRKEDNKLLDVPVGVGVFGAIFATYFSAAALGVALLSGHEVTLIKADGGEINVKDYLDKSLKKAKESSHDLEGYVKRGVEETKEFAKDLKENIEDRVHGFKEKGEEVFEEAKDKAEDILEEVEEKLEGAKDKVEDKLEDARDRAEDVLEELEEKVEDAKDKAEDKLENVKDRAEELAEEVQEEL